MHCNRPLETLPSDSPTIPNPLPLSPPYNGPSYTDRAFERLTEIECQRIRREFRGKMQALDDQFGVRNGGFQVLAAADNSIYTNARHALAMQDMH